MLLQKARTRRFDSDSDSFTSSECGDDDDDEAHEAALLGDNRWVPEAKDGRPLPPRSYTRTRMGAYGKDDFEPMSFGMQRIHNDDEPTSGQTRTAR